MGAEGIRSDFRCCLTAHPGSVTRVVPVREWEIKEKCNCYTGNSGEGPTRGSHVKVLAGDGSRHFQ